MPGPAWTLTGDTLSLQMTLTDGSIVETVYFANGSKAFPKERLEVFAGGRILPLDNFRKLTGFGPAVSADEPLAAGQGTERLRRRIPRSHPPGRPANSLRVVEVSSRPR